MNEKDYVVKSIWETKEMKKYVSAKSKSTKYFMLISGTIISTISLVTIILAHYYSIRLPYVLTWKIAIPYVLLILGILMFIQGKKKNKNAI